MRRFPILSFLYFQLALCFIALAAFGQVHQIKGKVVDEHGNPMPNAKVSIEHSKFIVSDVGGNFEFLPEQELQMPFELRMEKKGYKLLKFFFNDQDFELEVVAIKSKSEIPDKENIVLISDPNGTTLPKQRIAIDGKTYESDQGGKILVKGNFSTSSKAVVEGYELSKIFYDAKQKIFIIHLVATTPVLIPEIPLTPEELNLQVFQQYKAYFNKLSNELMEEKARIEGLNAKIKEELAVITNRLKTEKNLSPEQRKELHNYAQVLEKNLSDNSVSYKKSAERTALLIQMLKGIILEKDSVAIKANKKVEQVMIKNKEIEQKSQRNLIFFGAAILFFVALGSIFCLFFLKISRQKAKLEAANKEVTAVKNQLANNVLELKESNEQLEVFVYKASHDIKGPLRSIIGLTKIGKEDVKDPVALNYFEHILQSTKKLDTLLLDLLEVTKVKQATVTPEEVSFAEFVKDALSSFSHLPGYDQMKFNVSIQENGKFQSDKKLLYSVIQNLIENPIKYRDPNKKDNLLDIIIKADEKSASMKFVDNGLGIPEELQSKVFDMFFKIDDKSNGTGLGLYIVKTTVEKLRAKIRLESSYGKGTTFFVDLNTLKGFNK